MQTYGTAFEHELKKLIAECLTNVTEQLASGLGVTEIGQYREKVGQIFAYRTVLDLCDEAHTAVQGRERNI
jgi:hypothetical protein